MFIKNKIVRAFNKLISNDSYLFTVDANERSITHHFAIYLQTEFPEYHIDCEYNRTMLDVKRLESFQQAIQADNTNGKSVFPDIIVHHRGTNNNYIVIEAKKNGRGDAHQDAPTCKCDRCKLIAYKDDLRYRHAFFVQFPDKNMLESLNAEKIENLIEEI